MFLLLGLAFAVISIFLQAPAGDPIVPGVVPALIETGAAATLTGYLVGFFKKAFPDAASSKIVGVAIAAGLFSAVVASMVNGGIALTQVGIGVILFQGLSAAALSAGVNASNSPSTKKPDAV